LAMSHAPSRTTGAGSGCMTCPRPETRTSSADVKCRRRVGAWRWTPWPPRRSPRRPRTDVGSHSVRASSGSNDRNLWMALGPGREWTHLPEEDLKSSCSDQDRRREGRIPPFRRRPGPHFPHPQ